LIKFGIIMLHESDIIFFAKKWSMRYQKK
jgi:hypothetical protein